MRLALLLGLCGCRQLFGIDPPVRASDASADTGDDAPPVDMAPPDVATLRPRDCVDALARGVTTDGPVLVDPDGDGGADPFMVYCDMMTAGGGWTLVWVYTFTDYANFTSGNNAVTPRPTWNSPGAGTVTPSSTTIPPNPDTTGALDFGMWATFGENVLFTSNITNWVTCTPGGGSISKFTFGTMTCSIAKTVATMCPTVVPGYFYAPDTSGVGLLLSTDPLTTYLFWEGRTDSANWPTHDPCGANAANQVTGVANPRGRIYLRR